MAEQQLDLFQKFDDVARPKKIDSRIGCELTGPIPKPLWGRCGLGFPPPMWVRHYVMHLKPFNRRYASHIDYKKMKYVSD